MDNLPTNQKNKRSGESFRLSWHARNELNRSSVCWRKEKNEKTQQRQIRLFVKTHIWSGSFAINDRLLSDLNRKEVAVCRFYPFPFY